MSCRYFRFDALFHSRTLLDYCIYVSSLITQITQFMGPTWSPPGSCRPQMGPMLAPWTLLSMKSVLALRRDPSRRHLGGKAYQPQIQISPKTGVDINCTNSRKWIWYHRMYFRIMAYCLNIVVFMNVKFTGWASDNIDSLMEVLRSAVCANPGSS